MGTLEWEEDVGGCGGLSYGEVKEESAMKMMPNSLVLLAELQCPSLRLGFRPKTKGTDEGGVMIRMGKAGALHFPSFVY